jgi:hypothetical protein
MTDLKEQLAALGFKFEQNQFAQPENQLSWIAYRRIVEDHRVCDCNEKSLQLVVRPFKMQFYDNLHESCEVDVTGEFDGVWYKLQAYSMSHEELLERLDEIEGNLIRAWGALKVLTIS